MCTPDRPRLEELLSAEFTSGFRRDDFVCPCSKTALEQTRLALQRRDGAASSGRNHVQPHSPPRDSQIEIRRDEAIRALSAQVAM